MSTRSNTAPNVYPLPPMEEDGLPKGWPDDWNIPTIGWDVLPWAEEMLAQPDGDNAGDPWFWTPPQARYLAWWNAVQPKDGPRPGAWLYRRGQIVLPKGAGKSPYGAAIACTALLGPNLFDGFDASGEAVGRPHPSPHVQIAAVSQSQTGNTFSLIRAMLQNGAIYNEPDVGLDVGMTRVLTRYGGLLEPVTASATSREGQRVSDAILDEPHLWHATNGGTALAATIRRNLGKLNGRSIETTNCWVPGAESVAEMTYRYAQDILAGKNVDQGLLRYHPTANADDIGDRDMVRQALYELYEYSPWVDIDRVMSEIYDTGTTPSDARRFYLNQITVAADGWLAGHEWAACYRPGQTLQRGEPIALGFDGSRRRSHQVTDATALIACRISDGHLFQLGVWEQPSGPGGELWEAPRTVIQAAVHDAFDTYRVMAFYADPAKWESEVAGWEADYGRNLFKKARAGHPIEYWMTGGRNLNTVRVLDQFHTAVIEKHLGHSSETALTTHALNARRRPTTVGIQIAKESPDSANKIDAVVAAVLAYAGRTDAIAAGAIANQGQIVRVR